MWKRAPVNYSTVDDDIFNYYLFFSCKSFPFAWEVSRWKQFIFPSTAIFFSLNSKTVVNYSCIYMSNLSIVRLLLNIYRWKFCVITIVSRQFLEVVKFVLKLSILTFWHNSLLHRLKHYVYFFLIIRILSHFIPCQNIPLRHIL